MEQEILLLHNYLVVGALLFGIGLVGLLTRRNMIVMFLAIEMMLQGISLSLVAWSRFYDDFGGQMLVIFIIAVAACEAAIGLALILTLFRQSRVLDVAVWHALREADLPPPAERQTPEEPQSQPPEWPRLPPAGIEPRIPREGTHYRRHV
jgi:NADH-quinone oxidoreductase subunit K